MEKLKRHFLTAVAGTVLAGVALQSDAHARPDATPIAVATAVQHH